jgi:adenylyltransferase/sulfurtransferase
MLLYDALDMTFNTIKVRKNPECPVCSIPAEQVELIDYEQFCGMPAHDRSSYTSLTAEEATHMHEINVVELKQQIDNHADVVVLDVRDPHEWEIAAIDGTLRIPKGDIQAAKNAVLAGRKLREETVLAQIPQDKTLLVHCRSGKRSADSIKFLAEVGYDMDKMYNVAGGILAWADQIDPTLPKY